MNQEAAASKRHRVQPDASPTLMPPSKETEYFLNFSPPDNATPEEEALTADVVILDHRAHHQLRPPTREWDEVLKLLVNAVILLQNRDATQGRVIFQEAERVYYHHNQTKNRIRYLTGALIGVLVAGALGTVFLLFSKSLEQFITRDLLVLVFVFAGI